MKKYIILLSCFLIICKAFGQSEKYTSSYLVLYSGRVIYSNYVQYITPYFNTDKGKFMEDSVSFYKNRSGAYGNTRHLRKRNPTYFMCAVTFGNIHMYSQTVSITTTQKGSQDAGGFSNFYTQSKKYLLYNKGTELLKKANYKNLKIDMADNVESMEYLKQCRNIRNTEFGIYGLSVALLVVGIVNLANDGPDYLKYGAIPVSIGLYKITSLSNLKQKKIIRAFQAYN
jgi:hypothetical protein